LAGKKSVDFYEIDLVTANVQSGIPTIQDGDIAFIFW
jgi:hypothetical protein